MKKIILTTILIFTLAAVSGYAEEENAGKTGEASFSGEGARGIVTAGAAGVPDATPGAGITGSAMPFLSESFQTDLATGAATMSIPITVPPGRKNMQPKLALSYSSNNSNGVCGVGWAVPANYIQRSTKYGVPAYDDTDTFMFISSGSNAELAEIGGGQYRAKIESAFMKYTFDGSSWLVYDKNGTKYTFGETSASRLEDGTKTFGWYLDKVIDVHGNYITYIYEKPGDGSIYLKEIQYTGGVSLDPDKKIVFIYTDNRTDKLYSYRSGWKIATTRILSSIEVLLNNERVWRYELTYKISEDTGRNLLEKITVKDKDGNSLPPKTFTYSRLE